VGVGPHQAQGAVDATWALSQRTPCASAEHTGVAHGVSPVYAAGAHAQAQPFSAAVGIVTTSMLEPTLSSQQLVAAGARTDVQRRALMFGHTSL